LPHISGWNDVDAPERNRSVIYSSVKYGICFRPFIVGNSIKQGGVISPILFCVDIDNLLGGQKTPDLGDILAMCLLGPPSMLTTMCCSRLLPQPCEQCWQFVITVTMLTICTLSSMSGNPSVCTQGPG